MSGGMENEILFSRTIKAGKRVYYIDVKRDRHGEYYLSITESKRLRGADEGEQPVFEKHKIFLYREDMQKFSEALGEATGYVAGQSPRRLEGRIWFDSTAPAAGATPPEPLPDNGADSPRYGADF